MGTSDAGVPLRWGDILNIDPMQHTGLVVTILNTNSWLYNGKSSWTWDDAYQEGMIALIEALQTYDSELGTIANYCFSRIKWGLFRAYNEQQGLIRKPAGWHELKEKYRKIELDYIKGCQREPDLQYMASQMKMTVPELKRFKEMFAVEISLDAPLADSNEITMSDTIEDDRDYFDEVDTKIILEQLRRDLESMMEEKLTPKDADILKEYYGWYSDKQPTIKQLARKNNLTEDQTRRKLTNGLASFRKFRPKLVKDYPDLLMQQIYSQRESYTYDLNMMEQMIVKRYLGIGDFLTVDKRQGIVSSIDYQGESFQLMASGETFSYPFNRISDIEMRDRRITKIMIKQRKKDLITEG
ncbi:RNA polymerase sigma factor RpoD [anaerobic digester metagenome]